MADRLVQREFVDAYVYAIRVDDIVRYIGKGTRKRLKVHVRVARSINAAKAAGRHIRASGFYTKLAEAMRHQSVVTEEIIEYGLSTDQAFVLEAEWINRYPVDQLWNEVPGGDGFRIDQLLDPVGFRQRLLAGITQSWSNPERHKNASERAISRWQDREARARQSAAVRKTWASEELRQRHGEILRKRFNSNDQLRRRQKEIADARWARPGEREKQGIAARKMQERRYFKRHANLSCALMSFGS